MGKKNYDLSTMSLNKFYNLIHAVYDKIGHDNSGIPRLKEINSELDRLYREQGYSKRESYGLRIVALSKYYDALLSESDNTESEFLKMPVEWQWDVSVEITKDDVAFTRYVIRKNIRKSQKKFRRF